MLFRSFAHAPVDLEHELVEMRAAFLGDPQRLDEQVHQHRLAAPDAAPHVDALGPRLLRLEQLCEQPARAICLEVLLQPVEPLGGTALVETVFDWPGLGLLMVNSVLMSDFKPVLAVTLIIGFNVMLANFLVDMAYAWFDPRLRQG